MQGFGLAAGHVDMYIREKEGFAYCSSLMGCSRALSNMFGHEFNAFAVQLHIVSIPTRFNAPKTPPLNAACSLYYEASV